MDRPERPDWSALESIVGDLRRSLDKVGSMQQRLTRVSGTAWSDDRLVKVVVGPRGQVTELDLDPRIYRNPNSKALAAKIMTTIRAAVDDVLKQTDEMLDDTIPSDLRSRFSYNDKMAELARKHDADVLKEAENDE